MRPKKAAPQREESDIESLRELEQAPGGFDDLRLASAYSAMLDAQHDNGATDADLDDPFEAAASRGELSETIASELGAADALLRKIEAILPFTASLQLSKVTHSDLLYEFVSSSCGAESLDDLVELASESCSKASARIDELLSGD